MSSPEIMQAINAAIREAAPQISDERIAQIIDELAKRDVYLMHWPESRAPGRTALRSETPAGPMKFDAADLNGMGIRATISAELSGAAMVLNIPYADGGQLGSWLVARAMIAEARAHRKKGAA